jgi:prevent-host-death family protein
VLRFLARVPLALGVGLILAEQYAEAADVLSTVLATVRRQGVGRQVEAGALANLATALLGAGRVEEAAEAAEAALTLARARGAPADEIVASLARARVRLAMEGAAGREGVEADLHAAAALIEATEARAYAPASTSCAPHWPGRWATKRRAYASCARRIGCSRGLDELTRMTRSPILARMARTYPVYEAKAKLSEILRGVKRGRSVTISDRGTAVARVVPIDAATDLHSRLQQLEREGALVSATGKANAIRPLARKPGALRRFLHSRA